MTIFFPQCMNCIRFLSDNKNGETCTAFPLGIPEAILQNKVDHRNRVEGDRGLRYKAEDPNLRHPMEPLEEPENATRP